MGERLRDRRVGAFVGGVEQETRDAAMHVEQHEASDLLVGASKTSRQLDEHRPRDGGRFRHAAAEIITPQNKQLCVIHRDHVRRTRLPVDERELAEVFADAEYAQDDLSSILTDEHDLDASVSHDEQRVAGIVLEHNDAALRVVALPSDFRESLELIAANAGEKRDGCEKLYDFHASTPFRG